MRLSATPIRARLAVLILGILLAGWASWGVWQARQCRASCTPPQDGPRLRLTNGTTVPVLYRDLIEGSLYLKYVTAIDLRDHGRGCAEAQTIFRGLLANGDLGAVSEVMLAPTDPRVRIAGWTWKGPVYGCCVSPGFTYTKDATGAWPLWPVGCAG
jgi:hypothetical protein